MIKPGVYYYYLSQFIFGTINRDLLYCDLLAEVDSLIAAHPSCDVQLAGDFNTDLQINNSASSAVKNFISRNKLYQCDILLPSVCKSTYVNDSTHASSTIDYVLTSNADSVVAFNILDIDINLSDHLPLMAVCKTDIESEPMYELELLQAKSHI